MTSPERNLGRHYLPKVVIVLVSTTYGAIFIQFDLLWWGMGTLHSFFFIFAFYFRLRFCGCIVFVVQMSYLTHGHADSGYALIFLGI